MRILGPALGAALLLLSACDSGPRNAAWFARRVQHMVGRDYGPIPVTLKSAEAEGNALVFTFDGPAGWRGGYPSFMLTASFLDSFCETPAAKDYFGDGRTFRVDTLEAGQRPVRGSPVSRCREG